MPRQPLANTPGLPPYGQRSSERRKEQNRIAQRQLRERRQQQEAAQALKLQQQQSEIRRLHRLIADLQNENFVLRSQGHTRRRQSVIPISSLSRGLLPLAPTAKAGLLPTLEPNFKSLFARHSVDYSSLHGAGIHTGGSSHRISEPRHFKSWSSEDQRASTFPPHLRQPAVRGAVQYLGQQASRGPTRLHTGTSEDINKQADLNPEEAVPASNFCGNTHSSGISAVLLTPKPPTSNWLSRNTTPPMGHPAEECPTNAWLHSPQKLQRSPQLDPTPKTENSFFSPSSGDLASFWAGQPPNSPNKHGGREDVEHFSAPTLSIVPSDFFPASTPLMSSDRIQLRKTSESASSDTNSLALDSDNHSAFSSMSINQVHLPFIPPEVGSHHLPRCLSPTATASSPEAQIEERSLIGENKPIFFRSPFKGSNDSEMQEQPNFGLPLSWIETKKFSVEASSPLPIHAKSMFFEINEMWGSDF